MALAESAAEAAGLSSATTYTDHPVHGTTAYGLCRDMAVHPIVDPDDGNALANLTHDHMLAVSTAPTTSGQCRVSSLSFHWQFVITLPKAVDEPKLDSKTRSVWQSFRAHLKWHEEHHRAIFLECGKTFVRDAAKLTGPCASLEHTVRASIDKAYAACMVRQRNFDAADHDTVRSTPFMELARSQRPARSTPALLSQ
jgi:predicted secreted Zn-dependent protease